MLAMPGRVLKRSSPELIDELWDQLDNLQTHCKEFRRGSYAVYKSMSVILRTVLLGSSGHVALGEAVLPKASFYPLVIVPIRSLTKGIITPAEIVVTNDQGGELHYSAGGTMPYLGIEDGGVVLSKVTPVDGDVLHRTKVKNLFDLSGARLSLAAWLAQSFLRREWSIRSFIICVAHNDGGAHIGNSPQLKEMEQFGNIHRHLTERVSSYVRAEIAFQIKQCYPTHSRRIR